MDFDEWDQGAKEAAKRHPLKVLKTLPQTPGITTETARHLKWKSFKYMLFHKEGPRILGHVLRHPLRYLTGYLKSLRRKRSYERDGDFFLYNLSSVAEFEKRAAGALLVVGFSYCQKPHECPSGRFTPNCIRDPDHPVCRQCLIGKTLTALPQKNLAPLLIPTVHYIGDQIFSLVHANPGKEILFLITACELTLEMFGDWGNMVGVAGIGVRLDGRICNTMRAFELSERGIKPGLTVFTPETEGRFLTLIRRLRSQTEESGASA